MLDCRQQLRLKSRFQNLNVGYNAVATDDAWEYLTRQTSDFFDELVHFTEAASATSGKSLYFLCPRDENSQIRGFHKLAEFSDFRTAEGVSLEAGASKVAHCQFNCGRVGACDELLVVQ